MNVTIFIYPHISNEKLYAASSSIHQLQTFIDRMSSSNIHFKLFRLGIRFIYPHTSNHSDSDSFFTHPLFSNSSKTAQFFTHPHFKPFKRIKSFKYPHPSFKHPRTSNLDSIILNFKYPLISNLRNCSTASNIHSFQTGMVVTGLHLSTYFKQLTKSSFFIYPHISNDTKPYTASSIHPLQTCLPSWLTSSIHLLQTHRIRGNLHTSTLQTSNSFLGTSNIHTFQTSLFTTILQISTHFKRSECAPNFKYPYISNGVTCVASSNIHTFQTTS